MTTLYEGSNFHQTRRHYTESFEPVRSSVCTRGVAICSKLTDIYDQAGQDFLAKQWGTPAKQNSDLPVCALCARKAAKNGWEVAS